jgi:DUF4097 and DUF4098 domain-containing protein YvlB
MANGYPRRRSIFSGLLLILIGGLFLARNFGTQLPIWALMRRWWPLVFILWGLTKLYDHFRARQTGEAAPPTVSAAEILLVLLLLAVVGGAGIVDWGQRHGSFSDIWGGETYSFTEDMPARSVPKNAQITLRTLRGNIIVHAEDAAEIRVTSRKSTRGDNEAEARATADGLHVTVTPTDSGFVVEPQGTSGNGRTVTVDMEVHVPKGATLRIQSDRGEIQVAGITGSLDINGRQGDIEARQIGGDVTVESSRGDIRVIGAGGNVRVTGRGSQVELSDIQGAVTLDGEYYGPLRFSRLPKGVHFVSRISDLLVTQLSGRIETSGAGDMNIFDAAGNVTLTTTKRDLTLDNVTGKIHVENRSGNVTLRFPQPPKEQVEISNQSGDIDITMPSKSNFDVNARSDRGEVQCTFPELESRIERLRNDAVLEGSLGSKGPRIQLHTTYGTIRIRRGQ